MMKKEGYIVPVIVLTIICLVVSGIMGYVNGLTAPIIAEASAKAAAEARVEVLPTADSFEQVDVTADMPEGTVEVYKAKNGAGTVSILTGSGYGGTMKVIVGINADGSVSYSKVLEHSETAGLGARVADKNYGFADRFVGKTESDVDSIELISGSSVSSKCYLALVKNAIVINGLVG